MTRMPDPRYRRPRPVMQEESPPPRLAALGCIAGIAVTPIALVAAVASGDMGHGSYSCNRSSA